MNPETTTPDHSERAHAEFGPSSLKYVAICPGYHGKDGTSAASEMGTRIHEALEVRDPSALQSEEEVEIYERLVREEDEVFDNVFGGREGVTIECEKRLTLTLDVKTPTFGTSDIVSKKGNIGLQIDYKTGISKIDPPATNWQAKAYVLAGFQMDDELETIHFAFLVPKRDEVLYGTFHRSDVPRLKEEIEAVIRRAEVVRPMWEKSWPDLDDMTPSVNCRFCRHEDECPALGAMCIEVAKRYRPDFLPHGSIASSDISDPATIERLFVVAKIVEEWASGIKHKAMCMSNDGVEFETLRRKSMGALTITKDKINLRNLALSKGITDEEFISASDISANKLCDVIRANAPRGKKTQQADAFLAEATDLGIIEKGPTRYTLSQQ
jgi:hypothetical protein